MLWEPFQFQIICCTKISSGGGGVSHMNIRVFCRHLLQNTRAPPQPTGHQDAALSKDFCFQQIQAHCSLNGRSPG